MTSIRTDSNADFDPVARAIDLRPLLARNAAQAERDRRLPAENVDAIHAANLFSLIVPHRWAGVSAPLPITLRTFAELAKGCSSSGWVAMILGGVTYYATLLPDRGQEEIFANAPGSRVCGAGSPTCIGQPVDGGLRISGKFPFASGCWHASWGMLSVQIEDDSHQIVDTAFAFAPMSELEIEDTWYVAGMCGTGSNTLVASDVFVPEHRILSMNAVIAGEHAARRHFGEPSDNYAFWPAIALIGLAPVIGIAQAMLEKVIEGTSKRGITFTTYARQADSPVTQHQVAEAALKIDSAWLLATNAANEVERAAVSATTLDYLARARIRGAVGYATKLIREAVDTLASIGGASGFANTSPLQRLWRDANVASRHGLLATDPALEIYGRALLGLIDNISPVL